MFLVLAVAQFIIGMLGNVFIGLVNCSEWVKTQKISFADFILTCLAISRISYLLVILSDSFIVELSLYSHDFYKPAKYIFLVWRVTDHFMSWLVTCLSIFYFLKIAHFSHPLFFWLKRRVKRVVVVLLIFCLLLLLLDLVLQETFSSTFFNIHMTDKINLTLHANESITSYVVKVTLLNLIYMIPFFLSLAALLLLFLSLMRHTRNLEHSCMGSGDFSTKAHKKAMRMVLSFLFLAIVHVFCTQLVNGLYIMLQQSKFIKFVILTLNIFPSGHSFILILGNHKLRQTALRVLWYLKNHLKKANPLA